MSTVLPLLDSVIEKLKVLTNTVEIKYTNLANADETLEKTRSFDYYHLASNKLDTFDTYPHYLEEALIESGILNPVLLKQCMQDRNSIPKSLRSTVLENQRYIITRDFEEQNNYYRTYIGLPSTEDTEYFYVDEDVAEELGIDRRTPIHKLSDACISQLQSAGFVAKLIKKHPEKKYLKFLGKNKLDLYLLRTTKNFSIIHIEKNLVEDSLFSDFMLSYEQCREYFMVAVYIKEYASLHKYYDNIIAFMIMISTIRKVMSNTFKNGIERDFYDLTSIIKMLDAYKIPFIPEYTLEQHRIVLRNINNLIRIKGSDQVLINLVSLLGFTDVNMYKYYLVKSHKKDTHGDPIFRYKDTPLGKVLDKEAMYSIKFSRVNFEEKNIGMAVSNSRNDVEYTRVTDADPYWWNDDGLKNAIYENEFNYLETKYISFDIMYKMSKVVFETVFLLSMLHDNKAKTRGIELYFSKIDRNKPINLFDICILLFALTAKKNGLKGEIIHEPTKVGHVLGFNFKKDLTPILEEIQRDPDLNDPQLIAFIDDMSINSIDDVNRLYGNIRGFKTYISNKLFSCNDRHLYDKYKTIYNNIMTTEYMGELFILPDGDVAKTYKEYLMYINYELYEFFESVPKESITDIERHIITKIQEYCENLKYIHQTTQGINVNAAALITLVNFFKSYTVDVEQFNIIYIIDDRMDNLIKTMDESYMTSSSTILTNNYEYDIVSYTANIHGDQNIDVVCRTQHNIYISLDDKFVIANVMDDEILGLDVSIVMENSLTPIMKIDTMNLDIRLSHFLNIEDMCDFVLSFAHNDIAHLYGRISKVTTYTATSEWLNLTTSDRLNISLVNDKDFIQYAFKLSQQSKLAVDNKLYMLNIPLIQSHRQINDINNSYFDSYAVTSNKYSKTDLGLSDKLKIVYN